MADRIETRLRELGVTLPEAAAPAANYAPFVIDGSLVYVSGQISKSAAESHVGRLSAEVDVERGVAAARLSAINLIAQVKAACGGDLDRVEQVLKLTVFINAGPEFTAHPKVANGASDLIADVFGAAGRHARSAVGAASLPFDVSVEIEGVFRIQTA